MNSGKSASGNTLLEIPPTVELPFDIGSMKVAIGQTELDCMYRLLEREERKLEAWYAKRYTAWGAEMKEKVRHMKQYPPLHDRYGKSRKQYYPKTWNPIQFQGINNKGNHECSLLLRKTRYATYTRIPITRKFFRTNRTKLESILKYQPELKAIVLALDDACVPIRRLDRLLREKRHAEMKINKLLREHNDSPAAARNALTEQSPIPCSDALQAPSVDVANQTPQSTKGAYERRRARPRDF